MTELLRSLRRNGKAVVGLGLFAAFLGLALVGPWLAGDPGAVVAAPLSPPSASHWLGTTGQGQDVLAQTVAGARGTLLVALSAGLLVALVGALVGITAGYLGGRTDAALSLFTNVFLVIPGLPLAIVLAAYLPPGKASLIGVLVLSGWAWNARIFRAQALTLRRRDFVSAARVTGERPLRVIVAELLPNMSSLLLAAFIGATTYALGAAVGLEFLGLGDLGAVTWGTNLYWAANDAALLTGSWWIFVPTGLCVALVGFALTLANVALDELTNPRLRARAEAPARAGLERTPTPLPPLPVAASAAEALLSVRDLRVSFGATVAVDGVSFDFAPGEILGLAGESGSGKSTVGFTVLRLHDEERCRLDGQVRFAGEDILRMDARRLGAHRWAGAAMVFQSALDALNPVLTAGDQVTDVLRARAGLSAAAAEARARELFVLVGLLPEHLQRYPHQLSGGMRQRVVIAIALALRPRLLVMDEPTTALDVIVQREILGRVAELRRELRVAILLISHDLPLLLATCDRVGVMRHGRLLEIGAAATLATTAQDPYTRQLLAAYPSLEPPARLPLEAPRAPLLEVRGLTRRFAVRGLLFARRAARPALDDVSFDLRAGEVVALVGESGSGKSTLARVLARLERPDAGSVRLGGDDLLAGSAARHHARVQLVLQDPFASLNPARRVFHHLARPLRLAGVPRAELAARVAALLQTVGLTPAATIARRFPHELSGGQRQRVSLARALAGSPQVLVADEPTSMLDASLRAELLAILRRLADERGLGVLLITHDLASAAAVADRALVLLGGRVVEAGPVSTVLVRPAHDYTRRLLAAACFAPPPPSPSTTPTPAAVPAWRTPSLELEPHEAVS